MSWVEWKEIETLPRGMCLLPPWITYAAQFLLVLRNLLDVAGQVLDGDLRREEQECSGCLGDLAWSSE